MKFFETLTLLCTSVVAVSAFSCTCASRQYSGNDIGMAIGVADLQNPNPKVFGGKYPHRFGNKEGVYLPWCPGKTNYVEFPLRAGQPYFAGPPGADRVVYVNNNDGTETACGCMTHTGAVGNKFVACKHYN